MTTPTQSEFQLLIHPIRERSLFGLLSDEALEKIRKQIEIYELGAGEKVSRSRKPDHLDIVLSGSVALVDPRHSQLRAGEVSAGRSIELSTFLEHSYEWRYDWVAEVRSRILRLPAAELREALSLDPNIYEYLKRMTLNLELQRLKNDARLFGYSGREIKAFILGLEKFSLGQLKEIKADTLLVVHRGELILSSSDAEIEDVTCGMGDYLVWRSDASEVPSGTSDFEAWGIPIERLKSQSPEKAQAFLDLLVGQLGDSVEPPRFPPPPLGDDESRLLLGAQASSSQEEDDGLEVRDFKVTEGELLGLQKKKPVHIQQHDQMDCAAACLAMVAHYLGRRISLPTFRSLVHVTREGASMHAAMIGAKAVGLQSIGIMSGFNGLKTLRTPMIALMQYHFVVVYKITETEVVVGDPAQGIIRLTPEEFKKEWSSNCLLFRTTPDFLKFPESKNTFRKYFLLFQGAGSRCAEIGILSGLLFFLGLSVPLFMQYVFDSVLIQQSKGSLNLAAVVVIIVTLFSGWLDWIRSYLLSHLTARLDVKFATLFMAQIFSLPISFFAVRRVGDITTRLAELKKIRSFFTGQTLSLLISLVTAIIYSIILGFYSWKLLAVTWVTIPAIGLVIRVLNPLLLERMRSLYRAAAKSQSVAYEHFSGMETVKSVAGEVSARWKWETTLWDLLRLHHRFERLDGAINSLASGAKEGIQLMILLYAVNLYMKQELTVGQVVAVSVLVKSVVGPVINLLMQWESFSRVGVSFARVDDIFTAAIEEKGPASRGRGFRLAGGIRFEGVFFQYGSELSPTVLYDVNLEIRAGETVALVGRSGSGKTTLGYMVNLLYRPTKGRLLLDGLDATRLALEDLRSNIAMIIQENSIFSGTVLENISLGDPNPSMRRAVDAAMAADAHDFIVGLPSGYSTSLGEKGSGLSGGQRQRLNIARAFYRDPAILIMDEATSALDALSEQAIIKSIRSRERSRTTVIIAHRLNTVMHADRIAVMDGGRIIEQGSHAELVQMRGHYYSLFQKQLML